MSDRLVQTAGSSPRERWYVVDRTGRAVSVGYRHRADAQAELAAITEALRRELQRLGCSDRRIDARLAGFGIGCTSASIPAPDHRGAAAAVAHDPRRSRPPAAARR